MRMPYAAQATPDPMVLFRPPLPYNKLGLPRYCSAIWIDCLRAHLADSTRAQIASAIRPLYEIAESLSPAQDLDEMLLTGSLDNLETVLTSYLLQIRASTKEGSSAANRRWRLALGFVSGVLTHVGRDSREQLQAKLRRLEMLYAQLSPSRGTGPGPIRALPAIIVEELHSIFLPGSANNPYRTLSNEWRNFTVFMCLLHLGLRAGELLSLPVDALQSEFDPLSGDTRFWLNIRNDPYGQDSRARRPRIKNVQSIRQLPLPEELAKLIELYIIQYRGDAPHRFLFNSQESAPWAASSLALAINTASRQLSEAALDALAARQKIRITPHDLRHTSAVVRLQRLRAAGNSHDEAVEKLRPYFGWARDSRMPYHYGRAYFEPKFQDAWNETFTTTIEALRSAAGDHHERR